MTWDEIRNKRNALLVASDWTQLNDVSQLVDVISWKIYRQELRDITTSFDSPDAVVFPKEPMPL